MMYIIRVLYIIRMLYIMINIIVVREEEVREGGIRNRIVIVGHRIVCFQEVVVVVEVEEEGYVNQRGKRSVNEDINGNRNVIMCVLMCNLFTINNKLIMDNNRMCRMDIQGIEITENIIIIMNMNVTDVIIIDDDHRGRLDKTTWVDLKMDVYHICRCFLRSD